MVLRRIVMLVSVAASCHGLMRSLPGRAAAPLHLHRHPSRASSWRAAADSVATDATDAAADPAAEPAAAAASDVRRLLARRFDGHFDNYDQVVADRAAGLEPGPGGGHEHIHALIRPLILDERGLPLALLAVYYFEGQPGALFRVRCYTLAGDGRDAAADDVDEEVVEMRLWRLPATLVAGVRTAAGEANDADAGVAYAAARAPQGLLASDGRGLDLSACVELTGCEVRWRVTGGAFLSSAGGGSDGSDCELVAEMTGGGCTVESERSPGEFIRVTDDLRLDDDVLWINDCGYDMEGNFVYGNQRGVPYKNVKVKGAECSLAWTMGKNGSAAYAEPVARVAAVAAVAAVEETNMERGARLAVKARAERVGVARATLQSVALADQRAEEEYGGAYWMREKYQRIQEGLERDEKEKGEV